MAKCKYSKFENGNITTEKIKFKGTESEIEAIRKEFEKWQAMTTNYNVGLTPISTR